MMNTNNNSNPNNALTTLSYLSPLNSIHFLNYLIQPPIPLPPPPSSPEMSSFFVPGALSQRINTFLKVFDAQINRNHHELLYFPLTLLQFPDSIPPSAGIDELYFHIKYHLKQEPLKIFLMIRDLNNSAEQFYKFIKNSSEIKYFDASTFQILIKLSFMQQAEREFVAASYRNGQLWQRFQALAKFPSKKDEVNFFENLCKFFFAFVYRYLNQTTNVTTTNQSTVHQSFLLSFPYNFHELPSTTEPVTTPIANGNLNLSAGPLQLMNENQLGNSQSLQLNTISPASLALLIDTLKTIYNTNIGNGSTSLSNFPVLSSASTSAPSVVTVNQVSPAPSDPIPPIQDTPPKDSSIDQANLFTGGASAVTQTQGMFSFSSSCTIPGISQSYELGNNPDHLNHLVQQNNILGTDPIVPLNCLGSASNSSSNYASESCTSNSFYAGETEGNINAISSFCEKPESPVITNNFQEDGNHGATYGDYEQAESSHPYEQEQASFMDGNFSECIGSSEAMCECDPDEQQESKELTCNDEEEDVNVDSSSGHCKTTENNEEQSGALSSKKPEEDEFIEVDDFEPKVECHVPIAVGKNSTETPKIAPLKIKLKLLQVLPSKPKPLKRKSDHKSRKSYKEDDDDDNEYRSRIKIEDFDCVDTCYTDPLALRKIQRKTSAQIKQEQENFIELIYKQPDDENKLKVIYPNVQAEILFNRGDYITKFIGDIITSRSVYNENKDNPFLIEIGRNKWIDGKDRRSYGVYILPADIPQRANTTIKLHTTKNNIVFVGFYATQRIYPGEFLYFKR